MIPRFNQGVKHADAVMVDFRRKLVFFTCTMGKNAPYFIARVLAFVSLAMRAIHGVQWLWDGWDHGNLQGPFDPTHNSCAVSVLLVAHRLSSNERVPPQWVAEDMRTARDVISMSLLASSSFAPRWRACADADKQIAVTSKRWTLTTHSRHAVEDALIRAVHADYASASHKLSWFAAHGHAETACKQLVGVPEAVQQLQAAEDSLQDLEVSAVAGLVDAEGGVHGHLCADEAAKHQRKTEKIAAEIDRAETHLTARNHEAMLLEQTLLPEHELWVQFVVDMTTANFTDPKRGNDRVASLAKLLATTKKSLYVFPDGAATRVGTTEEVGRGTHQMAGTPASFSGVMATTRSLLALTPGRSSIHPKELPRNLSQEEGAPSFPCSALSSPVVPSLPLPCRHLGLSAFVPPQVLWGMALRLWHPQT